MPKTNVFPNRSLFQKSFTKTNFLKNFTNINFPQIVPKNIHFEDLISNIYADQGAASFLGHESFGNNNVQEEDIGIIYFK